MRVNRGLSWVEQFDVVVFVCLEELIGAPLDLQLRAQAIMRHKDGGISLPSARATFGPLAPQAGRSSELIVP